MVCKKCGAENEEWSDYCFKCNARLTPVKLGKVTKVTAVFSSIEAVLVAGLIAKSGAGKFTTLTVRNQVYFSVILVALLIAVVTALLFVMKQKKAALLAADLCWLIFLTINVMLGGSTVFSAILLLPVLGSTVSITGIWKELSY